MIYSGVAYYDMYVELDESVSIKEYIENLMKKKVIYLNGKQTFIATSKVDTITYKEYMGAGR